MKWQNGCPAATILTGLDLDPVRSFLRIYAKGLHNYKLLLLAQKHIMDMLKDFLPGETKQCPAAMQLKMQGSETS